MKRCPECRRDYVDDTLLYCLEDGAELVQGSVAPTDEPQTAILHDSTGRNEAETRAQIFTSDQAAVFPSGRADGPKPGTFNRRLIIAALALVIVLVGVFTFRYITNAKQIESIAVMPFVNESGNADAEYLSDGITETLISSLSQLADLNVKGRSSVFRYKGKDLDTKTLGKELGVQAVLYGRVIQRGDQLTLSLELLDASTENVIWSDKYDRKQTDVVSLQSEIARDVSNKLKSKLSGADVAKVEKGYTSNPESYKLYLQGRFYWNKRTEPDLNKSIEYFNEAIASDPAYGLAYAGLADAYGVMINYAIVRRPDETYPKASAAAEKARQLDPDLAAPHATLGYVLHEYEWRHAEAEKEFKRAIELDPNYASGRQWYGEFLSDMGRFDEGLAEQKRALEPDPLSAVINNTLGNAFAAAGRYNEAIVQYRKAIEIDPNYLPSHGNLAGTYALVGRYDQAIEAYRHIVLVGGVSAEQLEDTMAAARDAYRRGGEQGYGRWELAFREKLARDRGRDIAPINLARLQIRAGDLESALTTLEKSVESDRFDLVRLRSARQFDPLRTEPRFRELLRKIGLPE